MPLGQGPIRVNQGLEESHSPASIPATKAPPLADAPCYGTFHDPCEGPTAYRPAADDGGRLLHRGELSLACRTRCRARQR
ncbi:MAG: hypothetical protein CMH85_02450, partial [Novosphingobium sp.]|nr:hypothetical protein [Novosphingobium sp.]